MPKSKFYAVASGRQTGIFATWDECKAQTDGFKSSIFKSFKSREDAEQFLKENKPKETSADAGHAPKRPGLPERRQSPARKRPRGVDPTRIHFHINFDGGSRGNPGLAGCGAQVITRVQPAGTKVITRTKTRIAWFLPGSLTNNQAEYWGLTKALELVHQQLSTTDQAPEPKNQSDSNPCFAMLPSFPKVSLVVQGDSQLILKQMEGIYRVNSPKLLSCKERAQFWLNQIKEASGTFTVSFEHVYRKDNTTADELANQAMDAMSSWLIHTDENGEEQRHELLGRNLKPA